MSEVIDFALLKEKITRAVNVNDPEFAHHNGEAKLKEGKTKKLSA
jgi:hypothetical protein